VDKKTCGDCHKECKRSCRGPNSDDCYECKHVRDGKYCVEKCPPNKYVKDGICLPCHETCNKCTGPRNTLSHDGCSECDYFITNGSTRTCLHKNATCPEGYFKEYSAPDSLIYPSGQTNCRVCHPRCKKCTGFGFHESVCSECTKYRRGEQCEDECNDNEYADDIKKTCEPCHDECQRCRGPGANNCISCKHFKIFNRGVQPHEFPNTTKFTCTYNCVGDFKYKIFPDEADEVKVQPYCSDTFRAEGSMVLVIFLVVAFFSVIIILLGILVYNCKQKTKAKKDAVKMSKVLAGCEDSEPLRPSNVGPNLTKLRIIKEAEIRRGGILGMGAFGKVYKGVWIPEGENVKIPVAIKVLMELNGSESSKEFLDEAYIMASVEHPNLLKLHAVCMTSQMMLITQLMPLGCLLDYVRNNKDKIGSKALLNWSTQIARGMSYLEERRLVHRDLAARNVLVQTPSCVKITDFGLAKLLDYDSDTYRAAGGKMPIKWLALECIRHRIFTSKSDVWAFGVTIWELLTYGQRPYENIAAKDVPDLIEVGHKLPQPDICSLDVYCILLSCWVLDADSRPTFKQLADTFAEKARDPGRYLMISGDKFMRLPSYTTQDEKDLIRNLAPLDGSSSTPTILETEEYLQPKSRQAFDNNSNGQMEHNLPKRYCSDPLKNGDDETDTSREIGIGNTNIRLDLPLDEDDYLMPTGPNQNLPTTGYMDLGVGISQQPAIDNPEYLLNSNPLAVINSLSATVKDNNCFQTINNNNLIDNLNNMQMKPDSSMPTQTIGIPLTNTSEQNSDHEYYNDLQRELQPLHNKRNETTV
jgi:epidermal growth factor receptor